MIALEPVPGDGQGALALVEARVAGVTTKAAVLETFDVSRPLQVVQVDHTKADIFVVDEESRQPIGRPWLTLAMDVCSRMVPGFYLTMAAPSRLSTSLCLGGHDSHN